MNRNTRTLHRALSFLDPSLIEEAAKIGVPRRLARLEKWLRIALPAALYLCLLAAMSIGILNQLLPALPAGSGGEDHYLNRLNEMLFAEDLPDNTHTLPFQALTVQNHLMDAIYRHPDKMVAALVCRPDGTALTHPEKVQEALRVKGYGVGSVAIWEGKLLIAADEQFLSEVAERLKDYGLNPSDYRFDFAFEQVREDLIAAHLRPKEETARTEVDEADPPDTSPRDPVLPETGTAIKSPPADPY